MFCSSRCCQEVQNLFEYLVPYRHIAHVAKFISSAHFYLALSVFVLSNSSVYAKHLHPAISEKSSNFLIEYSLFKNS